MFNNITNLSFWNDGTQYFVGKTVDLDICARGYVLHSDEKFPYAVGDIRCINGVEFAVKEVYVFRDYWFRKRYRVTWQIRGNNRYSELQKFLFD